MKCLYILLLVAITQGFAKEFRYKRSSKLPPPVLLSLTAVDPAGFELEWTSVSSGDVKDPVTGYKVKIWELHGKKIIKYRTVNGVKTLVEEYEDTKLNNDKIPDGEPQEIDTKMTKILVSPIKFNVLYEVRVQAHTKTAEGPLSQPMRIKLHSDDHSKDLYKTV